MGQNLDCEFAETEAEAVLKRLQINDAPFCPFEIAKRHDILVEQKKIEKPGFSGCLMKVGDDFGILYSTHIKNDGFIRFTVAHELGHYFLPGHPELLFPSGGGQHFSKMGFGSRDKHEREADAFASALLMPKNKFISEMGKLSCGYRAIESLSNKFTTSLLATALRYATFSEDSVAIAVSCDESVEYCFLSQPLKDIQGLQWLKKGTRLPKSSSTWTFNKNKENVIGSLRQEGGSFLDAWFDGAPHLEVNEDVVGLGSYGKTLTVLFTDETISCDSDTDDEDDEDSDDTPHW